MGALRRRRHVHRRHFLRRFSFATLTAILFLLFAPASAINLHPGRQLLAGDGGVRRGTAAETGGSGGGAVEETKLNGLGSSPPTCRSKCGWCTPCKPVHVPIQPGFSMPLEYYPEAWRCKCGNKLFMP